MKVLVLKVFYEKVLSGQSDVSFTFILQGFLIFIFTVVKKPVYMGLRDKAVRFTSGADVSTFSTSQAASSNSSSHA